MPFSLSRSPPTTYWIPPAQCGLRASAAPGASRAATANSAASRWSREDFTFGLLESGQTVAVHREVKVATEEDRSLAGRHHARHEDLEVFHHLRDRGVDGELQRDQLLVFVHVEKALLDRVVHTVVHVEL